MRKLALAVAILFSVHAHADARLHAALDLLDPSARPKDPGRAVLGQWTAGGKQLWVVAAMSDDDLLRAAVLRERNGRFTLVARSQIEEPLTITPPYRIFLSLDLIPYRISPKETAFGVRVSNTYNSSAHSISSEALHLYRLHGGTLARVFADITSEVHYEMASDSGTEAKRVVIVAKTKHQGFHDLLVRNKETKETKRWRWNGTAYEQ